MNDLRDPVAYRIALGALGLALAILFFGIAWVAASNPLSVPVEFWFAGGALSGVFVGALIPFSLYKKPPYGRSSGDEHLELVGSAVIGGISLALLCITAIIIGIVDSEHNMPFYVIGATLAGVLLGLTIPAPGQASR